MSLLYDWDLIARPSQREPATDWAIWLIMTGRGWGKTLTGAQTTRKYKEQNRVAGHIALVGPTAADTRDVMLGLDPDSSGLLQVCPPWNKPVYEPSKRRAIWPDGTVATLYSAEEPNRLRGPQHGFAWGDEPAAWKDGEEVLSNLQFGLRRGEAKAIFTTTPRATPFVRQLIRLPGVVRTSGSMSENVALSSRAKAAIELQYGGTRLGRQEIYGELLEDNPDALWTYSMIDADRITPEDYAQKILSGAIKMGRGVVAVDPAVTANKASNATGILYGHLDTQSPPHAYIIEDLTFSGRPEQWATVAVNAYHRHDADRIIGEINNGGDLIENTIRQIDKSVAYKQVRATKGKMLRAEPVSALYEQHRVHHVGNFGPLEQQMTEYDGSQVSPDNLDALVWLLTDLIINAKRFRNLVTW